MGDICNHKVVVKDDAAIVAAAAFMREVPVGGVTLVVRPECRAGA